MTYKFNVIALKILAVCVCVCVCVEVDKHSKVYKETNWTWSSQNKFGGGKQI